MIRVLLGVMAFIVFAPCLCGEAQAERRVAIVVDTSGSMSSNDQPRYTVLASQIVADLLQASDPISVIRLPQSESSSCRDGPDNSLRVARVAGHAAAFQRQVDALLTYSGGNHFCAPVRTALRDLGSDPADERLLLFLADADGFGSCRRELTNELNTFRQSGGVVAAINIRARGGEFKGDPPFSYWGYARKPDELLFRVAEVYQKFLGSSRVQTGPVGGRVEVSVDPFVREAWLVVATEGEVGELTSDPGNPTARSVDTNDASGGVKGSDGKTRSYRIVHLDQPLEGQWVFSSSGLGADAGYMLLQDYALAVRIPNRPRVPAKTEVPLEIEIINELTGQPVNSLTRLPDLEITADIDGEVVRFRDDGSGGDKTPGDGRYTGTHTFDEPGEVQIPVRVQTSFYDNTTQLTAEIVEIPWALMPRLPSRTVVGVPLLVEVELQQILPGVPMTDPPTALRGVGPARLDLRDDGTLGDKAAGDGVYSSTWIPGAQGPASFEFSAPTDAGIAHVEASIEVVGELTFGPPKPIVLGTLGSGERAEGQLDLGGTTVRGNVVAEVRSSLDTAGARVEIQLPDGWHSLHESGLAFEMTSSGPWTFPVRAEIGSCPEALSANDGAVVTLSAPGPGGRLEVLEVPIELVVKPDAWLVCFWWIPASIAAAIALAILIYGYIWPFSFGPQLKVWISPEDDMDEGFPHSVRQVPGTRKGFYRHARVYICLDHRLSGKAGGAFVRLEARGRGALIQPWGGQKVYRQNVDGDWDPIPQNESNLYTGTVYRNELATVFFEVRRS